MSNEEQEHSGVLSSEPPSRPELPEAPQLNPVLPPRPAITKAAKVAQGEANSKMALASIAATSFITPVILLALVGYALDAKMKHSVYWAAGLGVMIGMAVGVNSLLRVLQRMED